MNDFDFAETLYTQGDLAGARELNEQVVAARRQVLGEEHRNTLVAIESLARTVSSQGELAEARKLHEHVVAARRRILGEAHYDTLAAISSLAHTLHAQGELAEARKASGAGGGGTAAAARLRPSAYFDCRKQSGHDAGRVFWTSPAMLSA